MAGSCCVSPGDNARRSDIECQSGDGDGDGEEGRGSRPVLGSEVDREQV